MRTGSVCGVLLVCVLSAGPLGAVDAVYRKSNPTPAQGTVTEVSKTAITVKPRIGQAIKVPISDIIRVRWDGEPAGLNLGRTHEKNGYLDKCLQSYEKAKSDYKGSSKNLKVDLDFLIARVHARFALTDPSRQEAAIQKLEAFRRMHPTSFRFYETLNYLGQVYLAKQDLEQAKTVFAQMRSAPLKAYQMSADVATARVLLAEKNVDGAQKLFSQVAAEQAEQPTELSLKHEAMLGKATSEQRAGQFEQAINTLDAVIKNASPQDSHIQAEAYLRQGDCLQAAKKIKPALLAYLHVDVLFSNEKALHPEALYHLARLWSTVGHPERAAEAQNKLTEGYPNNPWTKKFAAGK